MHRETSTEVVDPKIPTGYRVTRHENRGYDSPDRWFEARRGNHKLGEFGSRVAAIESCVTDDVTRRCNKGP